MGLFLYKHKVNISNIASQFPESTRWTLILVFYFKNLHRVAHERVGKLFLREHKVSNTCKSIKFTRDGPAPEIFFFRV